MAETDQLALDLHVDGPAEALEAWWTDLPDLDEAEDPREQPHRIERLQETQDGGVCQTTWRGPLGLEFTLEKTLHEEGPGSWRFVIPALLGRVKRTAPASRRLKARSGTEGAPVGCVERFATPPASIGHR